MKSKKFAIKKEYGKLMGILENEISVFMLLVFHGKENYGKAENVPFEFSEPQTGGMKEEDFSVMGRIFSYSPKEMKETLERSELKTEANVEKLLDAIRALEKAGYIEEMRSSFVKAEKRYIITEKGSLFAKFLAYSVQYPGQNKKEKIYPQY